MTIAQKEPSVWMLVALVQSVLWAFGVPLLCRSNWDSMFGSYSNETAELILMMTPAVFFIIYCLIMLPIYWMQIPFFEQYRIQRDKPWPWIDEKEEVRVAFWNMTRRSLKLASTNLFVLLPLMSILKIHTLAKLGFSGPSFETDENSWPTPQKALQDVVLLSLIHEFGFYSTHRLMHSYPSLYKYHKIHHEYKTNTALAAQHNHFVDFILSIGFPALLALSIINCHSVTQFQWTLWTMYANMDDHVGYQFPWSPVRWFPFAALTDEHEFHHSKNLGCFGSKLSVFNNLFGGYEHYWPWVEKRKMNISWDTIKF